MQCLDFVSLFMSLWRANQAWCHWSLSNLVLFVLWTALVDSSTCCTCGHGAHSVKPCVFSLQAEEHIEKGKHDS